MKRQNQGETPNILHTEAHCIVNVNVREITRAFFDTLWRNAGRRYALFSRWLASRPVPSMEATCVLQEMLRVLFDAPGDVCARFISDRNAAHTPIILGHSISLMAHDKFTLQWSWFTHAEQRFFRWLCSMHNTVFQRKQPYKKGIQMDQFVHSDVVWCKQSRRLLLRDLILLCRWQDPEIEFMPYLLLLAVQRERHRKNAAHDRDEWFLVQMEHALNGSRTMPHELLIESPRKPSNVRTRI